MLEPVCEIPKNSREKIVFQVGEYKGHQFIDMRVFLPGENGTQDVPTKKGLAIPLHLYPQFRAALAQVEQELITRKLIDREDMEPAD